MRDRERPRLKLGQPRLVSSIFFAHYQPRYADNQYRVTGRRPILDGPFPPE